MNSKRLRLAAFVASVLAIFAVCSGQGLAQDRASSPSASASVPRPTGSRAIQPVNHQHSQSKQTAQSAPSATNAQSKLYAVPQPKPKEEIRIVQMTNLLRKQKGKPVLFRNSRLDQAARVHAMNMAKLGTMNHVLDGKAPSDRIKSTGYLYLAFGENIANAWGKADNTNAMFNFWLNSPPHLANLLGPFTDVGVGVAVSGSGKYFSCQVFAVPVSGGDPKSPNPANSNRGGRGSQSRR
jgi:uncharacterized protein YkwD